MQASLEGTTGAAGGLFAAASRLPGPLKGAAAAAALIGGALAKGVAEYRKFETSLARIATTTGSTLNRVRIDYASLVSELSTQTGVAAEEIAAGVQKAISGGVTAVADVSAIVGEAARFQAAGLGSLTDAISATTTVYANFRDAGYDAVAVMNRIAAAAQIGEGDVADFAPAFKRLSGLAANLNIELDETGAVLANISQTAPSVSEGMTQVEGLFRTLLRPSAQAEEQLERLGLTIEDLRSIVERNGLAAALRTLRDAIDEFEATGQRFPLARLFRDQQGLLGFLNLDLGTVDAARRQIADAGDSTIVQATDEIEQTLDHQMARLGQAWAANWRAIGQSTASAFGLTAFTRFAADVFAAGAQAAEVAADTPAALARRRLFGDQDALRERRAEIQRELALADVAPGLARAAEPEAQQAINDAVARRAVLLREQAEIEAALAGFGEEQADAAEDTVDAVERTVRGLDALHAASGELIGRFRTQRERLDDQIATQEAAIARVRAAGATDEELAQAQAALQRLYDQRQQLDDQEEQRRGEKSKREADAELREAQRVAQARLDLRSVELDTAVQRLTPTAPRGREPFYDQRRAQLLAEMDADLELARLAYADNADLLAAELENIRVRYGQALAALDADARLSAQDAADAYRDALSGVAQSIGDVFARFEDSAEGWIDLLLTGLPRIIEQFDRLGQASEGLFSGQGGGGGAGGFLSLLAGLFGGFRAAGGDVAAGRAYVVGERGPELFVPGRAGEIVPGGGTVTINMPAIDLAGDIQQQVNTLIPLVGTEIRRQLMEARLVGAGR